jgi:hypothetical protein
VDKADAQRESAWEIRVPLFRVDIGRTLLVIADNEDLAPEVAIRHEHREQMNEPESVNVRKVTGPQDVPQLWLECRPYGDGDDRLSVAQILQRESSSSSEPGIEP